MTKLKITAALILLLPATVLAEVDEFDSAWGQACDGAESSFGIKLVNNLERSVDYRVCLEHQTGEWTCFVSSNVLPGALGTAEWDHFVCDATGETYWWWRDAGDYTVNFPNPQSNKNKEV